VVATDIAERAIVIGRALIENSRVRLTREDVLRLFAPHERLPGRIESSMSPSVFTQEQARFLDSTLRVAGETPDPAKANLLRLLALRVALLAHPMAQVRGGTIHRLSTGEYESITESCLYHYVDGLRLTTPAKLWELAQQINAGVFEGRATVMKRSILEALPEIQADVVYFDPPYPGVMSYEREYKVIDEILEGHSRPTSPFTAKDGANMIDGLLKRAQHIPIWVLSLGNAVVTIEELEAKMARLGRRTKAIALKYQHLPAVATEQKKATNQEFIVVGVDEDAPLLRGIAVGYAAGEQLTARIVENDVCALSAQSAASGSLAGDPPQQHKTDPADEGFASADAQVVAESHVGIDDPHAILVEDSLDGDAERGGGCAGAHRDSDSLYPAVDVNHHEPAFTNDPAGDPAGPTDGGRM
jgi:hypothetical protein